MLERTKRIFIWFNMCPADESASIGQRINHSIVTLIILFANVFGSAAFLMYFLNNFTTNLDDSLIALGGFFMFFGSVYVLVCAFIFRNKICVIFQQLTLIHKASKFQLLYVF